MATDKLRVTELDFDTIKTNLKNFFADQTEFTDYDFSGSGLSILLDVLAYNTHYMAYYLNMVANEMYLDSATQRDSVVSLAKQLGYTPRSKTGATALLNLSMVEETGVDTDFVKIPVYTQFNVTSSGKSYTFYTLEDKIVVWDSSVSNGDRTFSVSNLSVTQGSKLIKEFVFTGNKNQRFILDNPDIDSSTIAVKIRASSGVTSSNVYTKYDGLLALTSSSEYYFLAEAEDQTYEISFGDGVYGKKLSAGNVITVEYLTADGADANGLTGLELSSSSQAWGEDSSGNPTNLTVTTTTASASSGGGNIETIDSIKYLAPRSFQHQNRAVTIDDYKAILTANYTNISSLRVWGGESNNTKDYGKVFISIKPLIGEQLSDPEQEVVRNLLDKYKVIGIGIEIKDYRTISLKVNAEIKYNPTLTAEKSGTIQYKVLESIKNYNKNRLGIFDGVFRYSQLVGDVDDADNSIMSNTVKVSVIKPSSKVLEYAPTLDASTSAAENVNNADDLPKYLYSVKSGPWAIPTVTFNDLYIKDTVVDSKGTKRGTIAIVNNGFSSSTFNLLGHVVGSTGASSTFWNLLTVKLTDVPDLNCKTGIIKIVNAEDGVDITMNNFSRSGEPNSEYAKASSFNPIVAKIDYETGYIHSWKPFPVVNIVSGKNTIDFIGQINPQDIIPENLEILEIRDEYTTATLITDFDK
tara:strand:- start:25597 stop:27675 length:2079 start_codon:yes stop_codon:yes gene_type:complete